ncbi:MAG: hypothetical protein KDA99_14215, partial [Planctomycetales bacterium]|nr:hypothetical protein [Planctomycetales bacterium]
DAADYTIWKDNFGAVGSSAASLVSDVPEPCMQILCVLSFAILIRRTRKSRDTMTVINPITIAIGCLFTCGQTAHAVELMFSVNSTLSNISAELFVDDFDVFATVQGFAGETQMTVPWRGDIVVSLDDALAPSNVSFVSSQLRADTYGPMLPDASGGNEGDVFLDNDAYPGTAEDANYGWILDGGDVFQAYWAIRDLAISITSPEMDIQSNSFDPTGMTLTLSSGETALNYGSIFGDIALVSSAAGVFSLNCSDPGSSVFTGCSHPAVAHYAVSQNLATISLPIGFGFVPNEVVGLSSTINSLNFHGTLVASATIDIEQALPGDYNQNGIVDAADYTIWKDNFGSSNNLSADGNGNGVIDAADYTVWKDNFGTTQAAVGPSWLVPEPNSLQLLARCLATAGLFLPIVRRRNRPAPSLICGIAAQYGLTDSVGSNV